MSRPCYPRGPAGALLTAYDRLICVLVKFAEVVTVVIALFITISMILGVFFRFILNASIGWTDELSSLLLSVMMFVVIGIGFHERIHIGVGILFDRLSVRGRVVLDVVLHAISAVFFLIVCIAGLKVAEIGLGMRLATLDLPRGLFQYAAPVGGAFASLVCLNNMLKVALGGERPHAGKGGD